LLLGLRCTPRWGWRDSPTPVRRFLEIWIHDDIASRCVLVLVRLVGVGVGYGHDRSLLVHVVYLQTVSEHVYRSTPSTRIRISNLLEALCPSLNDECCGGLYRSPFGNGANCVGRTDGVLGHPVMPLGMIGWQVGSDWCDYCYYRYSSWGELRKKNIRLQR
jgi:hypothetical protein